MYFKLILFLAQANPDLMHAFQAAANSGGTTSSSNTSVKKSLNAAIASEIGAHPRGRGVDERAARAAAEVRKKAAARGLLIRPHGVPVQAVPPLTQLLNIINSGMTPDSSTNNEETEVANTKEEDGNLSNVQETAIEEKPKLDKADQAPVGLGKGLSSLDSKKQKMKQKAAA